MINLQFKTNILKIDSSVPSISLNYGRNLAKRPFAGSSIAYSKPRALILNNDPD